VSVSNSENMAKLNFTIAVPRPTQRPAALLRLAAGLTVLGAGIWTLHMALPADALPLDDWFHAVLEGCRLSQFGLALNLLHTLSSLV
jgi:hypothetical protein